MLTDEMSFASTNVSLSSEVPQRTARRSVEGELRVLRIAKLITDRGEELCRIKNISAGGVRAEAWVSHAVGERVVIELRADQRLAGTIAWSCDDNVGISFDENVDIAQVLSKAVGDNKAYARQPRVQTPCVARLHIGAGSHKVGVTDISQGGIKVTIGEVARIGAPVVVAIDGLPKTGGAIRWFRDGQAGIAFKEAFPFDQLTRWLGMRLGGHREARSSAVPLAAPNVVTIRPGTLFHPLGEAIEEIAGKVVPSSRPGRPYTAVITMAGKILAEIDVPTVVAGEAMIKSVIESMEPLRPA